MDLVHACAELGVTPSASAREAKRAYRKLVRRWHPDRFANDPQGQAEATLRLQRITEAYQAIVHALGPDAAVPPTPAERRYEPGTPLSREEIERLVRQLGTEGPLDALMRQRMWWWPLPFAFLFLTGPYVSRWHVAGGFVLLLVSPVLWWLERRRPPA